MGLHFGLVIEFHQFAAVEAFELSKALGNMRRRKLRTDDTEIMISLSRPVILNSIIQGLIEAGDLASRPWLCERNQLVTMVKLR